MNGRERMEAIISGESPDRFPYAAVNGWGEAIERWRREGMQEGTYSGRNVSEAIGLADPDGPITLPLDLFMVPRFPVKILKKGPEYVLLTDELGVTKRMHRSDFDRSGGVKQSAGDMSSMSEWVDFPVKDKASWKSIYEERLRPDLEGRLPEDWSETKAEFIRAAESHWVRAASSFPMFGIFGPMRELMGLPGLVYATADDPGLIHTMVDDLTDFWLQTYDRTLREGVRLDQVVFFEDMGSTKAPIIGPDMFREFLSPGYKKVTGGLKEMGVQLLMIDSDGNCWDLLPEMVEAGVNGFHPCEVQAGMDAGLVRESYPNLFLNGGIAKKALTLGEQDISDEVARRFRVAWEGGRYTPSLDHGAPPDIPWQNLLIYARYYKEWANKQSAD